MKILVVDPDVDERHALVANLQQQEEPWQIDQAIDDGQALQQLSESAFDVVVSTAADDTFVNTHFLRSVEARFPRVYQIILTGSSDRRTLMQSNGPMQRYLQLPCQSAQLAEAIRRVQRLPLNQISARVLEAISAADCIPPLPKVLAELNELVDQDDWSNAAVADLLERDPMLCAKILQLANSAAFGLASKVSEIEHAVSVVGVETIRSLIMAQSLFHSVESGFAKEVDAIMSHCFEVASLARQLMRHEKASLHEINAAFTAGLLHDVGKVVLLNAVGRDYLDLVENESASNCDSRELEFAAYGANHAEVGGYLLDLWAVPPELVCAVSWHHDPYRCAAARLSTQAVFAANWILCGASWDVLPDLANERGSTETGSSNNTGSSATGQHSINEQQDAQVANFVTRLEAWQQFASQL